MKVNKNKQVQEISVKKKGISNKLQKKTNTIYAVKCYSH